MTPHELTVLHHLGSQLIRLYCHHRLELTVFGKVFIRNNLMLFIANYLKVDIDELPDEQIFYRACNKGEIGSGNREKLAVLYYMRKELPNEEQLKVYLFEILKYERLNATPYWDRFVKENGGKKARSDLGDLPKAADEWVRGLREKDKRKLMRLLEREMGER